MMKHHSVNIFFHMFYLFIAIILRASHVKLCIKLLTQQIEIFLLNVENLEM